MLSERTSVEIKVVALKKLVIRTAGTLIFICKNSKPEEMDRLYTHADGAQYVYDPISVIVGDYQTLTPSGQVKSVQSMAELLYDFVQLSLTEAVSYRMPDSARKIICDALQAFEDWKNTYLSASAVNLVESGMSFDTLGNDIGDRNWADQNDDFRSAVYEVS